MVRKQREHSVEITPLNSRPKRVLVGTVVLAEFPFANTTTISDGVFHIENVELALDHSLLEVRK